MTSETSIKNQLRIFSLKSWDLEVEEGNEKRIYYLTFFGVFYEVQGRGFNQVP